MVNIDTVHKAPSPIVFPWTAYASNMVIIAISMVFFLFLFLSHSSDTSVRMWVLGKKYLTHLSVIFSWIHSRFDEVAFSVANWSLERDLQNPGSIIKLSDLNSIRSNQGNEVTGGSRGINVPFYTTHLHLFNKYVLYIKKCFCCVNGKLSLTMLSCWWSFVVLLLKSSSWWSFLLYCKFLKPGVKLNLALLDLIYNEYYIFFIRIFRTMVCDKSTNTQYLKWIINIIFI